MCPAVPRSFHLGCFYDGWDHKLIYDTAYVLDSAFLTISVRNAPIPGFGIEREFIRIELRNADIGLIWVLFGSSSCYHSPAALPDDPMSSVATGSWNSLRLSCSDWIWHSQ